ncbi:MAG: DUF6057 family protein [Prevotella sp.]|nr:DUF6057 family protein [Prevotella sp.]
MRTIISKYWKITLSLLFGLAVVLFWAVPYVSTLAYQEQYQLFLLTGDYFAERLSVPGGLADYVAEFITQFNYVYVVGAILLGLVFFLLQRLTAVVFRRAGASPASYPLTFVPALLLWAYMGNESVLLSFAVSLLAALEFILHFIILREHCRRQWAMWTYLLAGIPVFYWLFGASVWVAAVGVWAVAWASRYRQAWTLLLLLPYVAAVELAIGYVLVLPVFQSLGGLNYFRYPVAAPWMQTVVMAAFALLAPACAVAGRKGWMEWLRKPLTQVGMTVMVAALGAVAVGISFDPQKYDLIEYDYLVRSHQWDRIISKAEREPATTPLSVSCVNLALGMTHQLGDRLFDFYQNGAEGLFPTFTRDMTSPVPTSEVFYHLGMVNDAERYSFEAQEAIPNHRKSGRLMRRLAQCNIINGNYAVAAKYLRLLQKSLFYRQWANDQMRFIGNDRAVETDREYGWMRNIRIKHTDYLFSDREMDQMLGLLLVDSKKYDNRLAYEYLIAYELLQKDLNRFMQYYPLGRYVTALDHIPYATQQVLVGVWLQRHPSLDGMPYSVDRQNVESTVNFIRTYMADKSDGALSSPPLSQNAWHYLLMGSSSKKGKEKMRDIY